MPSTFSPQIANVCQIMFLVIFGITLILEAQQTSASDFSLVTCSGGCPFGYKSMKPTTGFMSLKITSLVEIKHRKFGIYGVSNSASNVEMRLNLVSL